MPDFSALDYVLRPNGWLDTFPESPSTHRFAVVIGGLLVGFTMLVGLDKEQAEFYIAIHPEHTGEGIGREATIRTLRIGFCKFGLLRVHLRVRMLNVRGISLYESVGFRTCGTKIESINNEQIQLRLMEMNYSDFTESQASAAALSETSCTHSETEDVHISDYSEWEPRDYLDEYYGNVIPDERITLQFLVESLREMVPVPVALEFGCGPTVHHAFPLVNVAGEVHMAEFLASNRAQIEKWLQGAMRRSIGVI